MNEKRCTSIYTKPDICDSKISLQWFLRFDPDFQDFYPPGSVYEAGDVLSYLMGTRGKEPLLEHDVPVLTIAIAQPKRKNFKMGLRTLYHPPWNAIADRVLPGLPLVLQI